MDQVFFIKGCDHLFVDIYEKGCLKKNKLLDSIQINLKYDDLKYNDLNINFDIVEVIKNNKYNELISNEKLKNENIKLNIIINNLLNNNNYLLKEKHRLLDKLIFNNK